MNTDTLSLTLPKGRSRTRIRRPKRPSPRQLQCLLNRLVALVFIARSIVGIMEGDWAQLIFLPCWIGIYAFWHYMRGFTPDVHWLEWLITATGVTTSILIWL